MLSIRLFHCFFLDSKGLRHHSRSPLQFEECLSESACQKVDTLGPLWLYGAFTGWCFSLDALLHDAIYWPFCHPNVLQLHRCYKSKLLRRNDPRMWRYFSGPNDISLWGIIFYCFSKRFPTAFLSNSSSQSCLSGSSQQPVSAEFSELLFSTDEISRPSQRAFAESFSFSSSGRYDTALTVRRAAGIIVQRHQKYCAQGNAPIPCAPWQLARLISNLGHCRPKLGKSKKMWQGLPATFPSSLSQNPFSAAFPRSFLSYHLAGSRVCGQTLKWCWCEHYQ